MARSKKEPASKPKPEAAPVPVMARKAVKASKLVPLEKRLGRLRKEEAKRQKQLKVVQEKAARTSEQMTRLLQSVTDRIEHSEAIAATESEPRNGIAEPVAAGH